MRKHAAILVFFLYLVSCAGDNGSRTVKYDENETNPIVIDSLLADTSKVLIADFPLFFDSTRVLIHPVGFVNIENRQKDRYSKLSKKDFDYDFDYGMSLGLNGNVITGRLTYLVFEDVDSNIMRPLTEQVLNIFHVEYLRELARETDRHYLAYKVQDEDTNRDGRIDYQDLVSLYVSKLDGTGFIKITSKHHQLDSNTWRGWCMRYYYRTLEDVNKDGNFDKRDKYHYYYIDFSVEPYQIIEYDPLRKILK